MMYDSLLSRSFSKHEQKKLGYGALVACFFISLSLCTVFKPYLGPLQVLNLQLSIGADEKLQIVNDTSNSLINAKDAEMIVKTPLMSNNGSSSQEILEETVVKDMQTASNTSSDPQITGGAETVMDMQTVDNTSSTKQKTKDATKIKIKPIFNTRGRSDFCEITGDIRIDGNSATIYVVISSEINTSTETNTSWSIKPYARKGDPVAMKNVREWSVKLVNDRNDVPQCTQSHNVPSVLFSAGGYSGNHFHAFTDVLIPLYATARPFNEDVHLLVTNGKPCWIAKFRVLLKGLSKYDIIDIDKKEDIHCFPSITVGLKGRSNKELSINPSESAYSMKDFRQFLRSSYSLKRNSAFRIKDGEKKRPRLLIISRKRSRSFTNVGEISKLAKSLGYKVVIAEPDANVSRFAHIMNSCDVVMGVHGAGLTNIVFLPDNAILIQVVPFGGADWLSRVFFEEPAKDTNIRYLEYKIRLEESTLIEQYPVDHPVLKDPRSIGKQGWAAFKSIYLDKQNVKLDVKRFRPILLKALELLHQ